MKDSGKFGGWFEKGLGMLRGDGGGRGTWFRIAGDPVNSSYHYRFWLPELPTFLGAIWTVSFTKFRSGQNGQNDTALATQIILSLPHGVVSVRWHAGATGLLGYSVLKETSSVALSPGLQCFDIVQHNFGATDQVHRPCFWLWCRWHPRELKK